MALLSIVTAPDPRLKKQSTPIEHFDDKLQAFAQDMLTTMYETHGIGLAAVQVGVLKRLIVMDLQNDDDHDDRPRGFYPMVMINPQITEKSEEIVGATEGCLSVPQISANVKRPNAIRVEYVDQYAKSHTLTQEQTKGWLARCIQHEMDHLDGITLLHHLSPLKRESALKKLKKLKKPVAPLL